MHGLGRAAAAFLVWSVAGASAPPVAAGFALPPAVPGSDLSVMTYNVHGLPWPLAQEREAALGAIADRLAMLRRRGLAPDVVVLEEAFVPKAREIGRAAGYRFAVDGSSARDCGPSAPRDAASSALAEGTAWWRGETERRVLGSGLLVLSDRPVVSVRRMSYGRSCAGWDCLASKGALLVEIALPGGRGTFDVVATHMNSRGASGAADVRSDLAHRLQLLALARFVSACRGPGLPLVIAGDLNVGRVPGRQAALSEAIAGGLGPTGGMRDALRTAVAEGLPLDPDARSALRRGKDLILYAGGDGSVPVLSGVTAPFGRNGAGEMLSDHVGYAAHFRLVPPTVRSGVPATG